MRLALALVATLLSVGTAPALAAQNHAAKVVILGRKGAYDGPAPHGGQMRTIGDHHIEWVVKNGGRSISVYLTDSRDRPVSAEGILADVYIRYPDQSKENFRMTVVKAGGDGTGGEAEETEAGEAVKTKDELMEEARAEIETAYAALRELRNLEQSEDVDEDARAGLVNKAGEAVLRARDALRAWRLAPEEAEEAGEPEAGDGGSAAGEEKAYLIGELKKMGANTTYSGVVHISVAGARYDIRYDYPLKPAMP